MKNLILISLLLPALSYAKTENVTINAIKAIFPNLSNSKNTNIKTKGCKFQKEKWTAMILTKQGFNESLKFNKDCDLEGDFSVVMDKYFPINLKVKGQKNIQRIISNIKLEIVFEDMPLLNLGMKDSIIRGEKNITFNMNYGVYIDPLDKSPLRKHKGGKLHIKKHGGKLINKTVPLMFK